MTHDTGTSSVEVWLCADRHENVGSAVSCSRIISQREELREKCLHAAARGLQSLCGEVLFSPR
jgi:hypothetical protein